MAAHSGPSASNDFRYTTMLLSGNGVNGSQNNTFMDSTAPGGYAVNFKGSPDGIYYDYGSTTHSYWNSDFTIEFWINTAQSTGIGAIFESWYDSGFGAGSYGVAIVSGAIAMSNRQSSGTNMTNFITSGSTLVSDGAWHHVAITQTTGASKTFRLFVDGVMRGYKVETNWTQGLSSTYVYIGEQGPGTWDETNRFFNGLLSNLRLVTSVVPAYVTSSTTVGTTVFTPPRAPLSAISNTSVLLCQSSTFVDNGPSAKTISVHGTASVTTGKILTRTGNVTQGTFSPFSLAEGQWSNHFLKSSNSILTTTNAAIAPNTGDFSMECWLLAYNNTSTIHIMSIGQGSGSGRLFLSLGGTTGRLSWNQYGSGAQIYTASNLINIGTWYHVVVTRASGYMRIFVNGVLRGAGVNTDNYTQTTYFIGGIGTETLDGYLSNVRYLNGSVPTTYQTTSTTIDNVVFTPPTSALTAITGTTLLTCQSNRFKDNSSNNFTLTPTGATKVTAFSPFEPGAPYIPSINGGSAYFDGSGDSLKCNPLGIYNTNFTIEAFIYIAGGSGTRIIATTYNVSPYQANTMTFGIDASNKVSVGNGLGQATASVASPLNTWIHVAGVYTHSNTTFTLYVNGTSVATYVGAISNESVNGFFIGGSPGDNNLGTAWWNGYISNLRVVKSEVYTGNFTPPTLAPLAATGSASAACYPSTTNVNTSFTNTSLLCNFTNAGIIDNAGKNDIETVGNAQISTSVKKYGTGSMYFDGTGDWLRLPNCQELQMGTGDFTWELWAYVPAATAQYQTFFETRSNLSAGSTDGFFFGLSINTLTPIVYTTSAVLTASASISANTWTHLALVRSSGTLKIYINGVASGSVSNSTNLNNTSFQYVGGSIAITVNLTGYIDDLRITKGLARYTSNFNPPSYPLKLR